MKKPPKHALKFLRWFCREDYLEEIEGDLTEIFDKNHSLTPATAKLKFIWSVIRYFRPEFIKSFKSNHRFNPAAMFHHSLLITYRNFLRHKTSFFINLTGLSTGLASVLLIYLWVTDELAFDKFHKKDNHLYQVMGNMDHAGNIKTRPGTPARLGESLLDEMPEVEYATCVGIDDDWYRGEGLISYEGNQVVAECIFASKDFFNVFTYPLIQGSKDHVLDDKNGVVISERLAKKIFGTTENIIGKTFNWSHPLRYEGTPHVSGIFQDPPGNSTLQFDIILNFKKLLEGDSYADQWNATPAETYLILKPGTSVDEFNKKISGFLLNKHPGNKSTLFLSQYSDKYLYGRYENGVQSGGRIEYVWLFSLIAAFILAIACINFMNLSTAEASRKMKEIGVKKSMGISRHILVVQFLTESIVIAFLSLAIGALLIVMLLPQFSAFTGKQLHFTFELIPVLSIIGIVLFTGIMSGCYPAFYLSGFDPVKVLKGKLTTSSGERWIRKGLVVMQFSISVIFIVAVVIVNGQLEFVQTKNLGYDKDNVVLFERMGRVNRNSHEAFMLALKNIPGVVSTSCMQGSILNPEQSMHTGFSWDGQTPNIREMQFPSPRISHEYIETLNLKMKEGRTFSDGDDESKIIINEAAARLMGFSDPIGRMISYGNKEKQIIGVVKNFHFGSLHSAAGPVFLMYGARESNFVVKIRAGSESVALEKMSEVYKKFHADYPFTFRFLDDEYHALYTSESKIALLSKYFAAIAIIISCLGLFGLATFTAQRRQKEIGIRKILGATQTTIVRLLSTDFTKMVLTAIVITIPLSYLLAEKWLESFAYHIELEWWFFFAAGLSALLISWITVGIQTINAARVNPTECLRNE
jgi:putative ABC transport system permease protein